MEFKTDWVADLKDLPAFFVKAEHQRNANQRQSIEGLEQIYGYMTSNANKYCILSNLTQTWFLRCIETDARKTLKYAGPIKLAAPPRMPSMLKAFVGMVLLAERDWFYASPAPDAPTQARFFGSTRTALKEQKKVIFIAHNYKEVPFRAPYPLLTLNFRLCNFNLSTSCRSASGCVVHMIPSQDVFNQDPLEVMCKIVDVSRTPDASTAL